MKKYFASAITGCVLIFCSGSLYAQEEHHGSNESEEAYTTKGGPLLSPLRNL
jgi:hypothetical protein